MMECSGRLAVAGDSSELELELGSNGGQEEKGKEGEWGDGHCGNELRRVISSRQARRRRQAATQLRAAARRNNGHLLLPTGEEEDDRNKWAGPSKR